AVLAVRDCGEPVGGLDPRAHGGPGSLDRRGFIRVAAIRDGAARQPDRDRRERRLVEVVLRGEGPGSGRDGVTECELDEIAVPVEDYLVQGDEGVIDERDDAAGYAVPLRDGQLVIGRATVGIRDSPDGVGRCT